MNSILKKTVALNHNFLKLVWSSYITKL